MRGFTLSLILPLAIASELKRSPHGPEASNPTAAVQSGIAIPASAANPASAAATCLVLPGDEEWPARAVWRQFMPEIEKGQDKPGKKHPDYRLEATRVEEVIAAVKFAKKYNVRLSILNSG
jgi:hypothetical protein